ncbi:rhomboid family intramembrane serine protease [Tessaracoccus sp. SD287]|uniref:rhomboid family intramembrane serine protease n=1 Tax=Tessaracoccus sp. SD287 TaxID=2782008 RepID=UPI001A966D92|nr:rhomboid family intramembrane serine protease [Tessaracoccus sp. SD287]
MAQAAIVNGVLVAVMWVLEAIDTLLRGTLDLLGIRPRDLDNIWSIFTAPWLHVGWDHLISNTIPFFVLGFFVLSSSWREWLGATAGAVLVGGLTVWLLAPANSLTLGASGIIFGWFGYLLVRGFITGQVKQIVVSIVVGLLYGGILLGVLPADSGVSWQGHLGGLVGGVLAAFAMHRGRPASARVSAP